jgi:hypothetical protein
MIPSFHGNHSLIVSCRKPDNLKGALSLSIEGPGGPIHYAASIRDAKAELRTGTAVGIDETQRDTAVTDHHPFNEMNIKLYGPFWFPGAICIGVDNERGVLRNFLVALTRIQ